MDDTLNQAQPPVSPPVTPGSTTRTVSPKAEGVDEKGFVIATDHDIELECPDCHKPFVFTVREQKIYEKYKYKRPRRDKQCRIIREEKRLAKEKKDAEDKEKQEQQ